MKKCTLLHFIMKKGLAFNNKSVSDTVFINTFLRVSLFLIFLFLFLLPKLCTSVQKTVFYLHFIDGASGTLSIPLLRISARCEMNKLLYACVTCSPSQLLLLRPPCQPSTPPPPRKGKRQR